MPTVPRTGHLDAHLLVLALVVLVVIALVLDLDVLVALPLRALVLLLRLGRLLVGGERVVRAAARGGDVVPARPACA